MQVVGQAPLTAVQIGDKFGLAAQCIAIDGDDAVPMAPQSTGGVICKTSFAPRRAQPADPSAGKTRCRA